MCMTCNGQIKMTNRSGLEFCINLQNENGNETYVQHFLSSFVHWFYAHNSDQICHNEKRIIICLVLDRKFCVAWKLKIQINRKCAPTYHFTLRNRWTMLFNYFIIKINNLIQSLVSFHSCLSLSLSLYLAPAISQPIVIFQQIIICRIGKWSPKMVKSS